MCRASLVSFARPSVLFWCETDPESECNSTRIVQRTDSGQLIQSQSAGVWSFKRSQSRGRAIHSGLRLKKADQGRAQQTPRTASFLQRRPSTLAAKLSVKFQIEKRVQDPLYSYTVDANVPITDIDGRPFMYQFISQLVIVVGYVDDGIRNRDLRSYDLYHFTPPAK